MDCLTWGYSSAGRAPALQAGGHQFESDYLHQTLQLKMDGKDENLSFFPSGFNETRVAL